MSENTKNNNVIEKQKIENNEIANTVIDEVNMENNVEISPDKKKYVEKLKKQVEGLRKIIKILPKIEEEKVIEEIRKLVKDADTIRDRIENNKFEIAVVGLEKAGKSTLINALIGIKILPSYDERCTFVPTKIISGKKNKVTVKFFSKEEMNKNFNDMLIDLGVKDTLEEKLKSKLINNKTIFDVITVDNLNTVVNNTNDDVYRDLINIIENRNDINVAISNKIYVQDSDFTKYDETYQNCLNDKTNKYITKATYMPVIKEVVIESSVFSKELPNAVIYDLPGFDSPTQYHKDFTKEHINEACGVVLVKDATKPSFTGPAVTLFKELVRENNGKQYLDINEKIFLFGNMADMVKAKYPKRTMEELEKIIKYNAKKECEVSINDRIVLGSAKAELDKNDQTVNKGLSDLGLNGSGIPELFTKLKSYNDNERFDAEQNRAKAIIDKIDEELKKIYEKYKVDDSEDELNLKLTSSSTANFDILKNKLKYKFDNKISNIWEEYKKNKEGDEKNFTTSIDVTKLNIDYDYLNKKYKYPKGTERIIEKRAAILGYYKMKFDEFMVEFGKNETLGKYKNISSDIRVIFLEAIKELNGESNVLVDTSQKKIEVELDKYLNEFDKNNGFSFYYKGAIGRFAYDMFNIIEAPFGTKERFGVFNETKKALYSFLPYDKTFIANIPLDEQPLIYKILFHKDDFYNTYSECLEKYKFDKSKITDKEDTNAIYEEDQDYLEYYIWKTIIEKDGHSPEKEIESKIKEIAEKKKNDSSIDEKEKLAKELLRSVKMPKPMDYKKYSIYFQNRENIDMKKEIEDDLKIFNDILKDTIIPACDLLSVYNAFSDQYIKKLIDYIDNWQNTPETKKLLDVIVNEINKITNADVMDEINKRKEKMEICKKIEGIMKEVKVGKYENIA